VKRFGFFSGIMKGLDVTVSRNKLVLRDSPEAYVSQNNLHSRKYIDGNNYNSTFLQDKTKENAP
jgi:hypothetical protein